MPRASLVSVDEVVKLVKKVDAKLCDLTDTQDPEMLRLYGLVSDFLAEVEAVREEYSK